MHNILSSLMGISAKKPVSRNIGNWQRNGRKTVVKSLKNLEKNIKNFFNKFYLQLKYQPIIKCVFENIVYISGYWRKTLYLNWSFSRGFCQFLSEFSILLKTVFSAEFPRKNIRHTIVCPVLKVYILWHLNLENETKRKKVKIFCTTFY